MLNFRGLSKIYNMKLSKSDILKLAKLAKLDLSQTEIKTYQKQLGQVLSYVNKINELKLNKVKQSLTGTEDNQIGPRPDEIVPSSPETINQAAVMKNGYVVSPDVFGK